MLRMVALRLRSVWCSTGLARASFERFASAVLVELFEGTLLLC